MWSLTSGPRRYICLSSRHRREYEGHYAAALAPRSREGYSHVGVQGHGLAIVLNGDDIRSLREIDDCNIGRNRKEHQHVWPTLDLNCPVPCAHDDLQSSDLFMGLGQAKE